MAATLISEDADELVIQVTIPKSRCFLQCEEQIQDALNEAGRLATGRCLADFDTDGSPILAAGRKLTAKRKKIAKNYETPYGIARVERYDYQSSAGGEVYIPLEQNARIVAGSTPRFAKIVGYLYSHNNSMVAQSALAQTLNRRVSRCFVQDLAAEVSLHVEDKARRWDYPRSEPRPGEVAFVAVGIDGTCLLFCEEGHRQAMVGSIALYDAQGERLHTGYVAAAPEQGKPTFLRRMDEEIARTRAKYPHARYVGISDGAADYLPWLKRHTTTQILDFWHVTEYLHAAAEAIHRSPAQREAWLDGACHDLKHEHGEAARLLALMEEAAAAGAPKKAAGALRAAISYFRNNLGRMNYASYRKGKLPIGSGVTEAACKSVVKTRMCGSGMQWKQSGADSVLTLRALSLAPAKWGEFWANVAKFGLRKPSLSR
jgi:hypothetical protein